MWLATASSTVVDFALSRAARRGKFGHWGLFFTEEKAELHLL